MISKIDLRIKAEKKYPGYSPKELDAYVHGFFDAKASEDVSSDFFGDLATKLRELWPPGDKGGKYPWRDSVSNLVPRLRFLWKERGYGDKYSVEDCLTAARNYLSKFENDTKYMQTLKYFIFKQEHSVAKDGKMVYTYKSSLGDTLENLSSLEMQQDWESSFTVADLYDQGEVR